MCPESFNVKTPDLALLLTQIHSSELGLHCQDSGEMHYRQIIPSRVISKICKIILQTSSRVNSSAGDIT